MDARQFSVKKPANPITQALYLVIGALLLVGAIVMGAVIVAFAIGSILIVGAGLWLRLWWLRRQTRRSGLRGAVRTSRDPAEAGEVIEAQYTIIEVEDSGRGSKERDPDR